jgi:hypothetical protein
MEASGELTRFQPATKQPMADASSAAKQENMDMRKIVIVSTSVLGVCLLGAATVMNPGRVVERPAISFSAIDADLPGGMDARGIDYLRNGLAAANGNGSDWYPPGSG